jgi:hypothetical protein
MNHRDYEAVNEKVIKSNNRGAYIALQVDFTSKRDPAILPLGLYQP